MSNLKLSFPDIPARAVAVTVSETFDEDETIYNSISGPRYTRSWLQATSASNLLIDFALDSGVTSSSDHLIIAHADQWLDHPTYGDVTDISVFSDSLSDYSTAATIYNDSSPDPTDLLGPDSEDYIATWSAATARRYWRLFVTKPNTTFLAHSKIYLGTFFDPGIDCSRYTIDYIDRPPYISRADSGSLIIGRRERPRYRFTIAWDGVSDALTTTFSDSILKIQHKHKGVFLYTTAVNEILDGHRLVHCDMTSARITGGGVANWNRIECTFEEYSG